MASLDLSFALLPGITEGLCQFSHVTAAIRAQGHIFLLLSLRRGGTDVATGQPCFYGYRVSSAFLPGHEHVGVA